MFHYLEQAFSRRQFRSSTASWSATSASRSPSRASRSAPVGLIRTAMRSSDILMDRVWQLETETFKGTPGFVFARVIDVVEPEEDPTALHPEMQRHLPNIRTDLDRFSPLEISSLIRHGYCVGRKGVSNPRGSLRRGSADERRLGSLSRGATWRPRASARDIAEARDRRDGGDHSEAAYVCNAQQFGVSGVPARLPRLDLLLYVPILIPVLILLPYRRSSLYQRSSSDQPDRRVAGSRQPGPRADVRLLDGPVPPFTGETAEEIHGTSPKHDHQGFMILQDSRIIDLRRWKPAAVSAPAIVPLRLSAAEGPQAARTDSEPSLS